MVISKKLYFFADSRGAGTNILKGVGGPNAYFYRNLYIVTPFPPLDLRMICMFTISSID